MIIFGLNSANLSYFFSISLIIFFYFSKLFMLGVKGNELNFGQTIYSSFIIWFTDSSSRIVKAGCGVYLSKQSIIQSINQSSIFVKADQGVVSQVIDRVASVFHLRNTKVAREGNEGKTNLIIRSKN